MDVRVATRTVVEISFEEFLEKLGVVLKPGNIQQCSVTKEGDRVFLTVWQGEFGV